MSTPLVESVSGSEIEPFLPALAALRITVFREYPYLYQGSLEYEQQYLRNYTQSPQSVVVLARAGEQVVGAATAMPLLLQGENVAPALAAAGYDPAHVYYLGESVLLPRYRGLRLGHAFFDGREAAAQRHGFPVTAFCAVQRADDHPARPAGYVPHDAFWSKRGYRKRPEITARFAWRDVGDADETEKSMMFWLREGRS